MKQIVKGEFMDMAELLKDSIEAERHHAATEGESSQGLLGKRGSRREMPDILSWLQCSSAYAAVLCNQNSVKAKELWAYQATMISAHRCKGERAGVVCTMHYSGSRSHPWKRLISQKITRGCM